MNARKRPAGENPLNAPQQGWLMGAALRNMAGLH